MQKSQENLLQLKTSHSTRHTIFPLPRIIVLSYNLEKEGFYMKKFLALALSLALVACAGADNNYWQPTPTVDFVESLNVADAPHQDSFLNMLAMNYRSYAIWSAREVGNFEIGELFANKAITAFSGDVPMPERVGNWSISDPDALFEMNFGLDALVRALRNDAADMCPEIAAEAQAKFDCWISAFASNQFATAAECRDRFGNAMTVLKNPDGCDNKVIRTAASLMPPAPPVATDTPATADRRHARTSRDRPMFYPDTANLSSVASSSRAREGVIIVNNVNIPEHLINPVPIVLKMPEPQPTQPPIIFNQNIFHGGHDDCEDDECEVMAPPPPAAAARTAPGQQLGDQTVSRDEFINMMMMLRNELVVINQRLDDIPGGDKAVIRVQQIPLEPRQQIVEEIFEIRFDFDRYEIKPEYEQMIRNLVATTSRHRNVRISVAGHTDTVGTADYNFALGGRRAEAVRQMLIRYGVPASQIVAVSSGKNDLKVPTGPGVAKAENRRVRVVKETSRTEPGGVITPEITVEQGAVKTLYGETGR
jgi:outer membrane protein OmpA-like peptidoglycan-associated protein